MAVPANIRLGCKGLPGTNILAYNEHEYITTVKKITGLTPGVNVIILFSFVTNNEA
jgi:hypothetical protein